MKKDKGSFLRLSNRLTNVDFPQYRDMEVMEIKQKQLALKSLENNKDNIYLLLKLKENVLVLSK